MGIVQSVEEFFGKKQSMNQQGQPVMETVEVPETPQVPDSAAPKDVETPVTETTQPKSAEDRSAYNCKPCGGEGLDAAGNTCQDCGGTGKFLQGKSEYPEGTIVVKPEGTFVVTNGQEVRQEAQA